MVALANKDGRNEAGLGEPVGRIEEVRKSGAEGEKVLDDGRITTYRRGRRNQKREAKSR
jgi:hypothetical protein